MKELREIFKEELVEIRKADVEGSDIDYEEVSRDDLAPEVQKAIDVFSDYMDRNDLGVPKTPTERINLLLDPRRKKMSSEDCVANVCVDNVQEGAQADYTAARGDILRHRGFPSGLWGKP